MLIMSSLKKILLVDDSRSAAAVFALRLGAIGHDVVIAENGAVAIEKFRAEAPDLDAYRTRLASLGHQPPPAVFRVDARSRDDVAMLVKALLYTLNPGLIDA